MTDRLRAAAQAALERLEHLEFNKPHVRGTDDCHEDIIEEIRAALDEQDAEPVEANSRSIPDELTDVWLTGGMEIGDDAQPRREWVSLTDEERLDAFDEFLEDTAEGKRWCHMKAYSYSEDEREAFDAGVAVAEAALKEKNA